MALPISHGSSGLRVPSMAVPVTKYTFTQDLIHLGLPLLPIELCYELVPRSTCAAPLGAGF